ncbi:MAG TPA: endonuclease/exonuclease/phosphatase family protein [Actinomycetota bacterium]|nr:endonuclease/exonuclease/phosphatase family protein [Actinomycetota bacterium]
MLPVTKDQGEGAPSEDRRPIRFMTFNVRFDTPLDAPGGNRWADRLDSVVETIRREAPDVLGVQEALRTQLGDLTSAFPDYRAVGKPREAGDVGEYVPVFFDLGRFDAEDHGDFWLSQTPEVEGSRGWDADNPRHCTFARLRDRDSGARFAVFNTHLDRWGALARLEAARLIVTRISVAADLPAVVLGDFNAEEGSEPMAAFAAAGLRDTFREAHPDAADIQTVHHYTALSGTRKIDYIMCDRRWRVAAAGIVREPAAGRLPSDHFPVVAELDPLPAGRPVSGGPRDRRAATTPGAASPEPT